MLRRDDFKLITLEEKELFDEHFSKYPPLHSDYVFSTMVCWHDYMAYYYTRVDNSIIIMTERNGVIRFRCPIGEANRELTEATIKLAKEEGSEPPLAVIDPEMKKWLAGEFPDLIFEPHRDMFDYVYLAEDLVELRGKDYQSIRNDLNYFTRSYRFSVEEITRDNIREAKDFLVEWCLKRGCEDEELLESEKDANHFAIDHFFELELEGIVIRINGVIEAFSVFEGMSDRAAVIHFEKGNYDYRGIYQAINRETAGRLADDYEFINREPDMGIPGLRRAKMKYRPHHMVELFHVERRFLD